MGEIQMKYFCVCASVTTGTNFSGESVRSLNKYTYNRICKQDFRKYPQRELIKL